MTATNKDLAHLGRTAKPFAWIGVAATALIVIVALLGRTIGADNFPLFSLYEAFGVVRTIVTAIAATLFCLSLVTVIAIRATNDELGHREEEWKRQLILLEIDEPPSEDPPTTDPSDVALTVFTRWYHASIAVTALFSFLWILLQALPNNFQLSAALPVWLYSVLGTITQLLFLTACEMTVLLILVRRWLTT